jgi:hypothetical protein
MVRFDFDVVGDAPAPNSASKPPSERDAILEETAGPAAAERLRPPPTERPS